MSPTDQVQELFDRAIASVSPRTPLPTHALQSRLHQRRIRARVINDWRVSACGCGKRISARHWSGLQHRLRRHALSLWFGVVEHDAAFGRSTSDDRAFARRGFHERLGCRVARQVGRYQRTQELASSTSFLTSSPELLVRSVACYARLQSGPSHRSHFRPYARVRNMIPRPSQDSRHRA